MDNYQAIAGGFQEIIELVSVSVDALAEPIQQASELFTEALLRENKILCCGIGAGQSVAQVFSTNLLHRFEQERPALPAMALASENSSLLAVASSSPNDLFSRQIRALGQHGDVLLAVATGEGNASIIQSIRAAHEREMDVVVLSSPQAADISSLLLPEDVELYVDSTRPPRIIELQTMIVHCLCEQIERALFGNYEL